MLEQGAVYRDHGIIGIRRVVSDDSPRHCTGARVVKQLMENVKGNARRNGSRFILQLPRYMSVFKSRKESIPRCGSVTNHTASNTLLLYHPSTFSPQRHFLVSTGRLDGKTEAMQKPDSFVQYLLPYQMAAIIAEGCNFGDSAPVVYVSGVEISITCIEQIGHRADRTNIGAKELFLYSSTDVEVHNSRLMTIDH
ncbi:hypothetical protein Dsin_032373 [Dipteronia sinensis]|uniref:Uncharacterized protein n=1 Tax=Dipteronia sinensis TaxID=43782 RepID=A0AAE0DTA6_9ROSI|nr:hypothetical protein Dsin_032373 [Dipteronia sinensis]